MGRSGADKLSGMLIFKLFEVKKDGSGGGSSDKAPPAIKVSLTPALDGNLRWEGESQELIIRQFWLRGTSLRALLAETSWRVPHARFEVEKWCCGIAGGPSHRAFSCPSSAQVSPRSPGSHTSSATHSGPPVESFGRLNPGPAGIFARGERRPGERATKAVRRAKRVKD
ncbi:hypothetical protein RRG08_031258 [Elysia crispata]|uniref:Uncharacterized protein n=1 Tax=Elysia crispata TaxID=231223 RepID=A0AAE1AJ35_9GAST|nr:hypothetical protein RRG08_031258 [Elysia crispata]